MRLLHEKLARMPWNYRRTRVNQFSFTMNADHVHEHVHDNGNVNVGAHVLLVAEHIFASMDI